MRLANRFGCENLCLREVDVRMQSQQLGHRR